MENNDALIYVIDSSDRERFAEAKEELMAMLQDDRCRNSILLILANKQDMPNAATASELTDKLGLLEIRKHDWYIQATCAVTGEGLVDGFQWLAPMIKEAKKRNK